MTEYLVFGFLANNVTGNFSQKKMSTGSEMLNSLKIIWNWNWDIDGRFDSYMIVYVLECQSMSEAGYSMLGAGAWGWPREMLWGGSWEGSSCLGTHVELKRKKKLELINWFSSWKYWCFLTILISTIFMIKYNKGTRLGLDMYFQIFKHLLTQPGCPD